MSAISGNSEFHPKNIEFIKKKQRKNSYYLEIFKGKIPKKTWERFNGIY